MTLSYESVSGTFRGSEEEISTLRERLRRLPDSSGLDDALREVGIEEEIPHDDQLLEAIRAALRTPVLTLDMSNSGPGGAHHHVIDAGVNGVSVRWSTADPEMSELSVTPFPVLPGLITRLVRFLPGRAPAEGARAARIDPETIRGLADESDEERRQAWATARQLLGIAADGDLSWQLVRAHCAWTATDGQKTEDLAVYLRAEEDYFVLVETEELLELVPVPSITAWEAMMHVLPGADEVKDPRR